MTLRVLFFGMEGIFSRAPLLELIAARYDLCAVIVPRPAQSRAAVSPIQMLAPQRARESDIPLRPALEEKNIIGIAWDAKIPVYEVNRLNDSQTLSTLAALRADAICVACFNLLIPQSLISNLHALNLHPSLLPAYRGPAPLFWIFHDGLENAGVTLHLMDSHADTGDIVAQMPIALPDGIRYADAERICSEQGARLMVEALHSIESGNLPRRPQPKPAAPRAPNPTDADYMITPDWSARRAFNFVRGIGNARLEIESPFGIGDSRFIINEVSVYNSEERLSEAKEKVVALHSTVKVKPTVE